MEWNTLYSQEKQPSMEDISQFIDNPLWEEINTYLQEAYKIQPKLAYSKCSAQPGWNVKYQKSGRSLCTLYPMKGYFIALVVIGDRETQETELLMPSFSSYIQELYSRTPFSCGGRWLMTEITNQSALHDVMDLMKIRVMPKSYV